MNTWDVVIVGAGAAGLFCAGVAGQRGLKVLVIDHSDNCLLYTSDAADE